MFEGFAILALSFAVAALVVAVASDIRTRRATREIARELVQLRDRLLRAEREGGFDAAPESAVAADDAALAAMAARVEELEGRLRELVERPAADDEPGATEPVSTAPADVVARELRRAGYGRVAVIEVNDDGSVRVEAERDGTLVKGVARVDEEGTVRMAGVSSVRAFP